MRLHISLSRRQLQVAIGTVAAFALIGGGAYFSWHRRSGASSIPAASASVSLTLLDYAGNPLPDGRMFVTGNPTTYSAYSDTKGVVSLVIATADLPASTGYYISHDGREYRSEQHINLSGASRAWVGWYPTGTTKRVPSGAINISINTASSPMSPTLSQLSVTAQASNLEDVQNLAAYYRVGTGAYKAAYGIYDGPGASTGLYRYHFDLSKDGLVAGAIIQVKVTAMNASGIITKSASLTVGKPL